MNQETEELKEWYLGQSEQIDSELGNSKFARQYRAKGLDQFKLIN